MTLRTAPWVARVAIGFLAVKLATLTVNLALFPTVRTVGPDDRPSGARMRRPSAARGRRLSAVRARDHGATSAEPAPAQVAVLIPMRDEAARLPATLPGLLGCGVREIVFLDDGSTDGSAELVTAAASTMVGVDVRVVTGRPRPAGWAGKTWACAQLAETTEADVLVFVDADVELRPGAVAAVVAEMTQQQADVFSVFPRQRVQTWAERLTTPLITDVVLCFLPFPLLRAPAPAAATANGSVLAFRRGAYSALGGFAAVRDEVVEDVAIARRTRRQGLRLGLALGGDLVAVRMYRSYREIVVGLGRGLVPAAGGRRWGVAAGLGWHLIVYTAPLLLAARTPAWRWVAALGVLERVLVEAKTGGRDWPAAVLVSLSPLLAVPVVRQSLRPEQIWKGRRYS